MFAVVGLLTNKVFWYCLAGVGLVTTISLAYLHYTTLVNDLALAKENQVKFELALKVQQEALDTSLETIDDWDKAFKELQRVSEQAAQVAQVASDRTSALQKLFAEHDLAALARGKPGLITTRINNGTADAYSLLECITAGRTDCTPRPEDSP